MVEAANFVCVVVIVAERGDTVPLKELRQLSVVDRALSKAQKVRSKYQGKVRLIVTHTLMTHICTHTCVSPYQTEINDIKGILEQFNFVNIQRVQ